MRRPISITHADARERVAVPFWNGIVSAIASIMVGFAASLIAMVVLVFAAVLITGQLPSVDPGHPLLASTEIVFYAVSGWFAWWRLRAIGRPLFAPFGRREVRAFLLGTGALVLLRIGTAVQLILTGQTNHVQAGFEHFSVVTKNPTLTALEIALVIVTTVVLGPLVEEIVFRGFLFGALAPRIGVIAAALVSALLFGAAHADPVLFPSLAALGLIAAFAYAATGNLWVSIALHATHNALSAIVLIASSLRVG